MERHILLLEDSAVQAKSLEKMIKNYSTKIQISYAASLTQARHLLGSKTVFDAFFLDISLASDCISQQSPQGMGYVDPCGSCQMDMLACPLGSLLCVNQKGLELATHIRSLPSYSRTPILFITAFPEHIYPAVNKLHCFAYLLKPYTEQEVHRQLAALFDNNKSAILLKTSENIYIRLALDSLQYIHSRGRYLDFVTTSASYRSRQYTLKELLTLLPDNFVRCHKSYIVNQTFVDNFDFVNHFAHITASDDLIPLSRNFHLT